MKKNISMMLFAVISTQFSMMLAKEAHWVKFVPSYAQAYIPEHAKQEKHCCKDQKSKDKQKEADWVKFVPVSARSFIPEDEKLCHKDKKIAALEAELKKEKFKKDKKRKKSKEAITKSVVVDVKHSKYGFQEKSSTGDVTRFGTTNIHDESISGNVTIMGPASFREIKIDKDCDIRGNAQFDDVTVNGNLTVMGPGTYRTIKINKDCDLKGDTQFDDVTVDGNLTVMGSGTYRTVKINKDCDLKGDAQVDDLTVNENLTVMGRLTGKDIIVKGKSTIFGYVDEFSNMALQDLLVYGSLKAQSSTFKHVEIKKNTKNKNLEVVLKDCTLNSLDIKVRKIDGYIELHNTTVRGDVQFTKKHGLIKLFGTSRIEGKIINATTEMVS